MPEVRNGFADGVSCSNIKSTYSSELFVSPFRCNLIGFEMNMECFIRATLCQFQHDTATQKQNRKNMLKIKWLSWLRKWMLLLQIITKTNFADIIFV